MRVAPDPGNPKPYLNPKLPRRCARAQVQLDIREGHAVTVDKVLGWIERDGGLEGVTVCDAGCGTGALAIPLALRGARVFGSDISEAMVGW